MLNCCLDVLYSEMKFKLYKDICRGFNEESPLSLTEVFCAELIYAMKNPTVKEFAHFLQVSSPNASYKIKNLVEKGYVKKIHSENDKREYFLEVTEKYLRQYGSQKDETDLLAEKITERFLPQDVEMLEEMVRIMSKELMKGNKDQ